MATVPGNQDFHHPTQAKEWFFLVSSIADLPFNHLQRSFFVRTELNIFELQILHIIPWKESSGTWDKVFQAPVVLGRGNFH